MERETMQDYLEKSRFNEMQAESLSRLLSETVTKSDLRLAVLELENKITESRSGLETAIANLESSMTRWAIALFLSLGTLIAILNVLT